MNIKYLTKFAMAGAVALVTACSSAPSPQETDRATQDVIKSSFRDQGIAKLDRLTQDDVQKACSAETPPSVLVM